MPDLLDLPVTTLDGTATTFGSLTDGRVTLVVNVASKCGLTPQYAKLEALQEELGGSDFTVLCDRAQDDPRAIAPCRDSGPIRHSQRSPIPTPGSRLRSDRRATNDHRIDARSKGPKGTSRHECKARS